MMKSVEMPRDFEKTEGLQTSAKSLLLYIEAAKREKALKPPEIKRVKVDTTVQEKAIASPTDARLYHKARRALVRLARRLGLKLRQSFERLGGFVLGQPLFAPVRDSIM